MRHVWPVREGRQTTEAEKRDRDSLAPQPSGDQRVPKFMHQNRNERCREPQNPIENTLRPSEQDDQQERCVDTDRDPEQAEAEQRPKVTPAAADSVRPGSRCRDVSRGHRPSWILRHCRRVDERSVQTQRRPPRRAAFLLRDRSLGAAGQSHSRVGHSAISLRLVSVASAVF